MEQRWGGSIPSQNVQEDSTTAVLFLASDDNSYDRHRVVRGWRLGSGITGRMLGTESATQRSGAQPYRRYGRLILHEENWFPLIRSLDTFTAVTNAVGRSE